MPTSLAIEEFACAICLETLHKPAVNGCGHSFCFWCMHHAMTGLGASHCPFCRAEFTRFPAICKPLHAYLHSRYPENMAERDAQIKIQEREDWKAESPEIALPGSTDDALTGFTCSGCSKLAAPPAVLSCGHIVCHDRRWAHCPVDGCVGTAPTGGSLAICRLIEGLLQAEYDASDYEAAAAQLCSAPALDAPPAPADVPSSSSDAYTPALSEDPTALVGAAVELHSLSAAASQELNGRRGTVKRYDAEAARLEVEIIIPTEASEQRRVVRVQTANVRRLPYVHFGRGCDGCGVYPIVGRCMKCCDCSEAIGFDLCGACFDMGMHDSGRFNQAHTIDHRMEEVPQEDTVLHMLQRAHPERTVDEIMALVSRMHHE